MKNIFVCIVVFSVSLFALMAATTEATGAAANTKDNEKTGKEIISTAQAPAAIGPYSQAVKIGNTLYLSGQLGIDPQNGKLATGFEAQARQALKNLKAVLEAAGFSLENVVQCQVFVKDMNNYPKFNDIYREFFKTAFPARAVLEVSRIPADGLIEIMMVAVK